MEGIHVKFFVDQDGVESVCVTSTEKLLQLLDLQHPIGEMIASAIQTHNSVYGCYSTTMVVLLGHWCLEFKSLLNKGLAVRPLLAIGDDLLASSIDAVHSSSTSLDQWLVLQQLDHQSLATCGSKKPKIEETIAHENGRKETASTKIKSAEDQKEENNRPAKRKEEMMAAVLSSGRPWNSKDERAEYVEPADRETWSTYQGILDDEDVSWFFNENNEIDLGLSEPDFTDDYLVISPKVKGQQESMRNVGSIEYNHDMCKYKIGKPFADSLQIPFVDSQGSSETDEKSLEILNDLHHLELRRNYSFQKSEPNVIDSLTDSDDEFAGCFEHLPNISDKEIQQQKIQQSSCLKEINTESMLEKSAKKEIENIDTLIRHKMKESSKLGLIRGMSQGRHFRTIKHVGINNANVDDDSDNEFAGCVQDLPNLQEDGSNLSVTPKIESNIPLTDDLVCGRASRQNIQSLFAENDIERLDVSSFIEKRLKKSSQVSIAKGLSQSRHFRTITNIDECSNNSNNDFEENHDNNTCPSMKVARSYQEMEIDSAKQITNRLDFLGPALSYGSDQVMEIAVKMFKNRTRIENDLINMKWLHICRILGPTSSESRVEAGILLPITIHQVSLVTQLKHSKPRLLLVSGDVQLNYHHLGYKDSLKPDITIGSSVTSQSSQKEWKQRILDHLKQLKIDIVVTKGTMDVSLFADCLAESILVVERVKFSVLKLLTAGSEANVLTYLMDAEETDVGHVSLLKSLEGGRCEGRSSKEPSIQNYLLSIQTEANLQTAVLCAPSQYQLDGLEDQLMSCVHRLTQALLDEKLIPGAGYAEILAIHNLNKIDAMDSFDMVNKESVTRALQSGWESYLLQLAYNCNEINDWSQGMSQVTKAVQTGVSPCGCDIHSVVDCVSAKVAAWKTAWKLLGIILKTDTHIVTGLDDSVL
ncbi:uncharacterized protein [Antedon mediterranea]|uniref:uncharacterized protein n=1 Tax=Antedon mediterranea TaxID=105859 RepID=UPI003AF8B848